MISKSVIISNLSVYGVAHAIVDATCAAIIFSIPSLQTISPAEFFNLVIIYNVLAFGLQSIFGLLTDYLHRPKSVALSGCLLAILSTIIFPYSLTLAIIMVGIGNALFHVGAGSISLNLTPKKATAPGIFVAPGAIGILIGTLIGKFGYFIAWPFVLSLVVLCILIQIIREPKMDYHRPQNVSDGKTNYFELILILVLLSVTVRSLVGSVIFFPWKSNITLLIILTVAVFLGKGLGGVLADRFGWMRIAVGSLLLSLPLLVFGTGTPILAIVGMFLFNITMPITLVTISNILPGRPGFSFGLTCLALIIGALPSFLTFKQFLGNGWIVFSAISFSSLAIYYGLHFYFKNSELRTD